ncbi:hypothetical protein ACH4TP_37925 [Streptomyces sp. NPDC021012]|uniref:hypothetical protein n=1 Tax=Streptomyces sp. NPDC021012 TaxID=3365107 RepID=UPI00378BDFAF
MAASTVQPHLPPRDLVTLKEARRLFAQTPHPVSERTMRRWGVDAIKHAGIVYVSLSDLLVAHGEWVAGGPVP